MAGSLKVAGIAAASVFAVHVLLTFGDWWRLSYEARERTTQMEAQFREVFPDAQVVVDAPLQMQRGLSRLRQDAGVPDASDFIPLLAAVAPALTAAGLHPERLRYERGTLELDVVAPEGEGREPIEKHLATPGHRVQVEGRSAGPSGQVVTLRISAEG
jgi:general secretion pathway protein L